MPFKKPHHTSDGQCPKEADGRYVIKPRGLNIVWGNDARYWKIPEDGPAELIQVSWLEVSGVVRKITPGKYRIKFLVRVKQDGFGWHGTDVLVMAKVGKMGKYSFKPVRLTPGDPFFIPEESLVVNVGNDESQKDLHFGLYEVWSGKWKGGLEIIRAELEPVFN